MSAKLISLIGPPAVGKTTLAQSLARELPAELILEDYAGNPFLAESYTGQKQARLPSQLYFLLSRVGQLNEAHWPDEGTFISDYGFCQDGVFARLRLDEADLKLYQKAVKRTGGLVHPPDVLIHLDATPAPLLKRIAARGREFEKAFTPELLSAMREAYNTESQKADCPVIRVDCESVDILQDGTRDELIRQIREQL